MTRIQEFITLPFVVLFVFSCQSNKATKEESNEVQKEETQIEKQSTPIGASVPIPPSNCKVLATVVAIDKALSPKNAKDPCSKAPCSATVRIDSVLGYGSAFPKTLSRGQRLPVKFTLTLAATKDLFPDMKPGLPGLSIGSQFTANISGTAAMGKTEPSFAISDYEKK